MLFNWTKQDKTCPVLISSVFWIFFQNAGSQLFQIFSSFSDRNYQTTTESDQHVHKALQTWVIFLIGNYVTPRAYLNVVGKLRFTSLDINQRSLSTPFYSALGVYLCLYGPFNCILFHKFSKQLSAFSLCSFGLISALIVLSTVSPFESLPKYVVKR